VVLINLTQQKENWQAVVHMVMNFVLCKLSGICWLAEKLLAPLYGCWSMTLHYLFRTPVEWSYHQHRSQRPSLFHNILDKISHSANCNKNSASFGWNICPGFSLFIYNNWIQCVHSIKSLLKLRIGHIWHPTNWECILCNATYLDIYRILWDIPKQNNLEYANGIQQYE